MASHATGHCQQHCGEKTAGVSAPVIGIEDKTEV